jgi:hypothetical protein
VIWFLLTLAAVWLFVVVPWSVWDARRPYVPGPPVHPRPGAGDVVVHHVHHVEHAHTVRHVHEVWAAAERIPASPRVVEGAVVQTRELPR